jgi:hypothetical protein
LEVDDIILFRTNSVAYLVDDFEHDGTHIARLGALSSSVAAGAACSRIEIDRNRNPDDHGKTLRVAFGGSIGLDLREQGFSFCGWETKLGGIDLSGCHVLQFRIRGNKGGERPNIYLEDGVVHRCVDIAKYNKVATEWSDVSIPLADFAAKGVDLTHVEGLEVIFEWNESSGTVWLDDIWFR